MRYLSIIRAAEQQGAPPQGLMEAIDRYVTDSLKDGTVVSTGGLAPSTAGVRVRVQRGRLTVTDGPFAETKEWLGGYYVIEAADLDAALDYASRIPNAGYGHVEVRPVMQVPGM
jgi:hypothetical protein